MDNNSFDLQGGGSIIDPVFNGKRCALRNLFGLAISPQTPLSPLVEAICAACQWRAWEVPVPR